MLGAPGIAATTGNAAAVVSATGSQVASPVVHPEVPQQLLAAQELHRQMRGVPITDRYSFLSRYFDGLARRKLNGHLLSVMGPFGHDVDHVRLNRERLDILERTYGPGGHNVLLAGLEAAVTKARSGTVLTWNLYDDGDVGQRTAVATASLKLHVGAAELCAAASPLQKYSGGIIQYRRLSEFFGNEEAYRVWGLQSELRASQTYTDPTGQVVPPSAATQHNNVFLAPWLMHSGVVYTNSTGDASWVEAQIDSRFFVQPEGVERVLFTPEVNPADRSGVTILDIARVTYTHAFGAEPDVVSRVGTDLRAEKTTSDMAFSPPRIAVKISGAYSGRDLDEMIENEERRSNMLEFAVLNHPDNIKLQEQLYKRGFIPVGVWPGGEFTVQGYNIVEPTYLHFQRPRRGFRFQLMPYELARDYSGTPIDQLMARLAAYWAKVIN